MKAKTIIAALPVLLALGCNAGGEKKCHDTSVTTPKEQTVKVDNATQSPAIKISQLAGNMLPATAFDALNKDGKINIKDFAPKRVALVLIGTHNEDKSNQRCGQCINTLDEFENGRGTLLGINRNEYITPWPELKKITRLDGIQPVFVFQGNRQAAAAFIKQTPYGNIVPKELRMPKQPYYEELKTPFLLDESASLMKRLGEGEFLCAVLTVTPDGKIEKVFTSPEKKISVGEIAKAYTN